MKLNFRIVAKIIGFISVIVGVFMLLPALVSYISKGSDAYTFLYAGIGTILLGAPFTFIKVKNNSITKREGYLIVSMGWITMCIVGSLPYFIHHDISLSEAIFESTSGFTTTGATIFNNIESLSQGTLFWRSLTQWIGGMGIIVFTIAIFPLLGIGGVELFVAEAPGVQSDKLHPRIKEVAKRLWLIYVGLTVFLTIILKFFGDMNLFDSVNHALTTMSTGGFSTKNDSIAYFSTKWVQYPIMLFMFIGGMNYTIIYFLFKGNFKRALKSDEWKFYIKFVLTVIIIGSLMRYFLDGGTSPEIVFREVSFQAISIITTTGFITADYTAWHHIFTLLFFILIFVGGSGGSTTGGIKMIRHLVFFKNSILEFKRILNPAAFLRIKIDGKTVDGKIITRILVFLLFYLIIFIIGSIVMIIILNDDSTPFLSAIGSTATCLSNVGPAIGSVGPVNNFAHIPAVGKIILSMIMVIGRLEVFSVLIIVTPFFWKNR